MICGEESDFLELSLDSLCAKRKIRTAIGCSLILHALTLALFLSTRRAVSLVTPKSRINVSLADPRPKENGPAPNPRLGTSVESKYNEKKARRKETVLVSRNGLLKASAIDLRPRLNTLPDNTGPKNDLDSTNWKLQASGNGSHKLEKGSWRAEVKRDGQVSFQDKLALPHIEFDPNAIKVSLPFDLAELAMRLQGETLDSPHKKKFLNDTREAREQMAQERSNEQLLQAVFDIRSKLEGIWSNPQLTIPEKKQQLFALWDECEESESDSHQSVTTLIRISILRFVARVIPQTGEYAYSEDELARLNLNRQSRVLFDPYALSAG